MGKVETKAVTVNAECGTPVTINVPVGAIVEPTAGYKAVFNDHCDPKNWKLPLKPARISSEAVAKAYADCVDFYCGGHEMTTSEINGEVMYIVTSKGYYHYVGA